MKLNENKLIKILKNVAEGRTKKSNKQINKFILEDEGICCKKSVNIVYNECEQTLVSIITIINC